MRLGRNLLEVDVVAELHVLGVDLEDFEPAGRVGDANVHLAVEAAESSEGWVNGVGPVRRCHDDDVGAGLHAVHEGEELRDDSPLHLAVCLFSLGRNRVDFVDEDDGGRVFLGLLKCLAQVRLGFTGHLGHDFGTVDEEEEGTRLVGDGSGHEGLAGAGRSVEQDAAGRLDPNGLEELGMTQGQLNHLTDLSHLLAAAANVVVADLIQIVFLLITLDRLAFAVNDGVLGNDAVLWGVDVDHLELNLAHAAANEEEVALTNRPVGLEEIWGKKDVKQGPGEALDSVGDGQNSDSLGLRGVRRHDTLRTRGQGKRTYLMSGQG